MAFNQAQNNLNLMMWEIVATVPGWTMDNGQLWILACFGAQAAGPVPITIYSPMLEPKNPNINNLFVKGVKHIQDGQLGTRTEVTACLQAALSADTLSAGNAPYGAGTTIATNAPGGPGRRDRIALPLCHTGGKGEEGPLGRKRAALFVCGIRPKSGAYIPIRTEELPCSPDLQRSSPRARSLDRRTLAA